MVAAVRRTPPMDWARSLARVSTVEDLFSFITASPSPYHAVAEAGRRLTAAGFTRLDPNEEWPAEPGRYFVARGGAMVAWSVAARSRGGAATPFRIIGAHTDSPNLRIKPRPDTGGYGWKQLAVEVYGGALLNSWLDRDLGLSGRVVLRSGGEPRLVRVDRPLMRVPQLAIHLDRDVNRDGLRLNPQLHLTPVWGTGAVEAGEFAAFLADELSGSDGDVDGADIAAWDVMLHDLTPPARLGRHGDLLASARLDNLVSCWAALESISAVAGSTVGPAEAVVPVVCLYDHEEVGSTSATGADGGFLGQVLERIGISGGAPRADHLRALAASVCVSADMAHATHPNHPERHDPLHPVTVNGGPVIKVNANQRYATDATTAGMMVRICEEAEIPHQWFVSRNDMPCGSTIGPLTAAHLGMATVDIGVAQLSMHSARELCGADDPPRFVEVLTRFLGSPAGPS